MITTPWKEFDGGKLRIRAEYGFRKLGEQEPYFSITAEIQRKSSRTRSGWAEDSGGCLHEDIAKHFPELRPLIKWHLCFAESGPMHYIANAVYWWEIATGRRENTKYGPDPVKAFASAIVLGAVNGERNPQVEDAALIVYRDTGVEVLQHLGDVEKFLTFRFDDLMAAMCAAMVAANVEVPAK